MFEIEFINVIDLETDSQYSLCLDRVDSLYYDLLSITIHFNLKDESDFYCLYRLFSSNSVLLITIRNKETTPIICRHSEGSLDTNGYECWFKFEKVFI